MNLNGIVSGAIGAVNPLITGTVTQSTGYTTGTDFSQVPTYAAPVTASMQVQELTQRDLAKLDGLNIQGVLRAVYLDGNWNGVIRPSGKGGDLLNFNGQNWLVVQVPEQWPDWTKVIVCLQQ